MRIPAIISIKSILFGFGEGSLETRAQPGLVTGSFIPGTNILKCQ